MVNVRGLIVAGCLSQQYQDELFQEIPEIDALIGTGAWDQVMVAVDAIEHGNRSCIMENITNIYDERMPRIQTTPRYSAYVKLQRAVTMVVPSVLFLRCVVHSVVVLSSLLRPKWNDWLRQGLRKSFLSLKIRLDYGIDLNDGKPLLTTLLKELTTVEGIEWIRMLYLYQHSSPMNC